MFEDKTYENLLNQAIAAAPEGINTRQGEVFFDSVAPMCLLLARIYTDLSMIADDISLDTATGENLDLKAKDFGLTRTGAVTAKYIMNYTGTQPPIGARFLSESLYFRVELQETTLFLRAEIAGSYANNIAAGTPALPYESITGLTSSTFGALEVAGQDVETDEAFRARIQDTLIQRVKSANKAQYLDWCLSIEGVGAARILPKWNGANTVGAVIITPQGTPPSAMTVASVQSFIDPDNDADGEGDGLGMGEAPIGARFTAWAAESMPISITATVKLAPGAEIDSAQVAFTKSITEYFRSLSLYSPNYPAVVVYSQIGAMISSLPEIIDYSGLLVGGDNANITLTINQVPILSEVTLNV
ncbi:MAG: baseplate J/gp47 family protein [Oscillospiraceae bacterium]|jgi:uncharacterized phage protein gp47/JayE|nr:baseplate J/gp47 family protein [Oscillospiraceae bacterium]